MTKISIFSAKVVTTVMLFVALIVALSFTQKTAHSQINPSISQNVKIVAFGDSLVAGVGSSAGNDFVSVLSSRIGLNIINAGRSGDTTAQALARVDNDVINQHPNITIVLLGGNDIIQNLDQTQLFNNLRVIVRRIQDSGSKVILIGVYGQVNNYDYEAGFRAVASETGATYVSNVMAGIAGNPDLTVTDLVHPNDAGYQIVADRIFPVLQATINSLPSQDLTVTCSANTSRIFTGESVTWSAFATGGAGNYRYEWSGTDSLTGSNSTVSPRYDNEGSKTATVKVTSGSLQATRTCSSTVTVQDRPLVGACSASIDSRNNNQYRVLWNLSVAGGNNATTYEWSGGEGLVGSSTSVSKLFTTPGLKSAWVTVRSGSHTLVLNCSATIDSVVPPASSTNGPLQGSCNVSTQGRTVRWSAGAAGGDGTYQYTWTGDEGLSNTTSNFSKTYGSDGVKTGTVTIRSGSETQTYSCQASITNVSDTGTGGNSGGCFIATAAFGTELEPRVMVLRKFRDETLLPHYLGKIFVDTYYAVSPPIAHFIARHDSLRAAVRVMLTPVVYSVEKLGYRN